MKRGLLIVALLVWAVLAVSALAVPPASELRIVDRSPATVAGVRFKPAERVKLVLASEAVRHVQAVTASRFGRFTAEFQGVRVDRCSGFVVQATGSLGSRAVLRNRDLTECPSLVLPEE
jgi:hypothetical protein